MCLEIFSASVSTCDGIKKQQTTTWCEILVHRCPNNQRHPVVLDSFGFAQLQLILQSVSDFASYASSECKLRHCPTKRRCNYHPTPRGPTISQKRFTFGPQRLGWYFWRKREQVTIGRPSFGIECYWDTSCSARTIYTRCIQVWNWN